MQDEDVTTKTINGWKKLNTLAHYGVKESAVMSLIAKPIENFQKPCHNCKYIHFRFPRIGTCLKCYVKPNDYSTGYTPYYATDILSIT